jgi:Holliday junction resolvase RusA-like endonuclease
MPPTAAKKKAPVSPKKKAAVAVTTYSFQQGPGHFSCDVSAKEITVKCKIFGTPRPMYRVQAVNKGGKMHVYAVSNTNRNSFAAAVKDALACHPGGNPFHPTSGNRVSITAVFYFKRPNNHFSISGLRQSAPKYVTKNPDVDNLMKLVMDALQGCVYSNDNVVTHTQATKLWLGSTVNMSNSNQSPEHECTLLKITEFTDNALV